MSFTRAINAMKHIQMIHNPTYEQQHKIHAEYYRYVHMELLKR